MRASIIALAFVLAACASKDKPQVPVTNTPAPPPIGASDYCKQQPQDQFCTEDAKATP